MYTGWTETAPKEQRSEINLINKVKFKVSVNDWMLLFSFYFCNKKKVIKKKKVVFFSRVATFRFFFRFCTGLYGNFQLQSKLNLWQSDIAIDATVIRSFQCFWNSRNSEWNKKHKNKLTTKRNKCEKIVYASLNGDQ